MSLLDDEERERREKELFPGLDLNIDKETEQESVTSGESGEIRIPASLNSVVNERLMLCTKLGVGETTVSTVEHLLSALEVCKRVFHEPPSDVFFAPQFVLLCAKCRIRLSIITIGYLDKDIFVFNSIILVSYFLKVVAPREHGN